VGYERAFSENSYGFRPGKSAHQALKQAARYVAEGKTFVIDLDLEKFFDEVNHHRLMWLLSTRIGRIFESWPLQYQYKDEPVTPLGGIQEMKMVIEKTKIFNS